MSTKQIAIILTGLWLGGSGCVAAPVSSLTPEQAAESPALSMGDEIIVQPTILGLGGRVVGWFGGDEEERLITINEWVAGEKVRLGWSISTQVETVESSAVREAHQQQYATSPVGTDIPDEPEPVYEERVVVGTIATESLASASTLMLPEMWPQGDGGVVETSLIWFPRSHYEELVNTRSTIVSLGLFDESLLKVEDATSKLSSLLDRLWGLIGTDQPTEEETTDTDSLLRLEADPQWGEYRLFVDGVQTRVRVVEAKNAFASYSILANADNPLILEIQLTPLSRGNLELLSSTGFAEGFGGYEVTQINKNSSQPL
ncbi:MAG: hypothetical protein NUV84_05220 [Candidatus Uhrbacteria bacterium]|nr:hypothetical protein [Candidatus Uhrbacteria bacterium]